MFTRWEKNEDYVRMDGSTGASKRRGMTDEFNDASNKRLRLFLISTKAGMEWKKPPLPPIKSKLNI